MCYVLAGTDVEHRGMGVPAVYSEQSKHCRSRGSDSVRSLPFQVEARYLPMHTLYSPRY